MDIKLNMTDPEANETYMYSLEVELCPHSACTAGKGRYKWGTPSPPPPFTLTNLWFKTK